MKRLLLVALAACGSGSAGPDATVDTIGPVYVPGDPLVVSSNSPGNDEDPALLVGRDGAIYLAWYSHAYGDHIVISRTNDGVHWTGPVRITSGAAVDFGPSLYQDQAGVFHAVFFRWETGAPPGKIVHARSVDQDGLSWDGTSSNDVTDANATDDWVPSLAANANGDLVVAFARNTCPPPSTCYAIETATSTTAGASWSPPTAVVSAAAGEQHHLPAIALDHGELAISWDPYKSTASAPWADAQSGAHISLLRGGTTTPITTAQPTSVTLFPTFYADGTSLHLAWMYSNGTSQQVVQVPLANVSASPAPLPIDGYSPRIVATPTDGVFLAAWVGGPDGERDIYVRVFR